MVQCPRCGLRVAEESLVSIRRECPNCGLYVPVSEPRRRGPTDIIRSYFKTVWKILTRPTEFFRNMPSESGMAGALAFALVTHWIASAFQYLWMMALRGSMMEQLEKVFRIAEDVAEIDRPGAGAQFIQMRERILEWVWGAGAVIIDPFITLVSVLFSSFFVFLGARLLVRERDVTFDSAVRIVAYGMTPVILSAIPLFGGPIAWICTLIVTIIGAKEVYRIGTGRAAVVALFPKLLFLGIIMAGLVLLGFVLFNLFSSVFV